MKKTLTDLIDDICQYIDQHNGVNSVFIEGNKTNILIEKEKNYELDKITSKVNDSKAPGTH